MAQESVVWYSEEWNTRIEDSKAEVTNSVKEEMIAGELDNKTLGDLLVRYLAHMGKTTLGDELFNMTFGDIGKLTEEEIDNLKAKIQSVFDSETTIKEFFPKG